MADADQNDDYDAIFTYLQRNQYPIGFDKSQKWALRRKASSYKAENGILYYCACRNARGPREWKQVPRSVRDRNRILEACHALPEGKSLLHYLNAFVCVLRTAACYICARDYHSWSYIMQVVTLGEIRPTTRLLNASIGSYCGMTSRSMLERVRSARGLMMPSL